MTKSEMQKMMRAGDVFALNGEIMYYEISTPTRGEEYRITQPGDRTRPAYDKDYNDEWVLDT